MDDIFSRPRVVYNRDANQLGNDIPTRYVPGGAGDAPDVFRGKVQAVLDATDPTQFGIVQGIKNGTLGRDVVASFARDLSIYAHRLGALDGLVAWKAEWYGFDNVLRISQASAQNWGYWTRDIPLAERLIPLAEELGADVEGLPMRDCSMNMHVYLRVRESLNQGGAGLEVGLASTFAEAQWAAMAPLLIEGLVSNYGVSQENANVINGIADLDVERGKDRMAILEDVARSRRQQDMTVRAAKEILSVFKWSMDHLQELSIVSRAA